MASTYDVGTRCWVQNETEGWIGADISKHTVVGEKHQLELTLETTGEKIELEVDSLDESNTKLPLLRNPPILESTEDLTSLSYLNEPAVLHAIKKMDQLYSADIIQAYSGKIRGELEPHLFAIAEDAYRCMKDNNENQTIVVSGESGAGKTVSAKYIMRYFATVEEITNNESNVLGSNNNHIEMSETEQQILATNPIMEAFGNAKTTRNDNSSRFGKYLEILFDDKTAIIGARIRTYLLERSRLVFQPKGERNYHIFYQILSGLNEEEKSKLMLTNIDDYNYLNQGGDYHIKGVDDAEEYKITSDALSLIGIDSAVQLKIYQILASLLHLGNIEIKATRNDALLSSDEPNLVKAAELLGIDANSFAKWIVKKQIITRSEKIVSNLNHKQALVARDSVAKYIYSALFDWLVSYINNDLCKPEIAKEMKTFIGVLDIYGFEHFEKNSFEQFCINYANEKLQQEFNQHVFKLEQEEYIKEKIEWSFIEFSDNQPCIDLIEKKLGILSLLDEESRLPAGSDESWINKMYSTLDKEPTNKVFKKPRFGQTKFIVAHYALDVPYDIEGFIEKNRDTVSDEHLEVLKNSKNDLLIEILDNLDKLAAANAEKEAAAAAANANANKRPGPARTVNRKPTLGSLFKNSLIELMKTIDSTNVHYIRCIKPNEEKTAWKFDPLMVLSQLRACGVLETIKISCAGFPSRWTYEEFGSRYHILLPSDKYKILFSSTANSDTIHEICNLILSSTVDDSKKYQLGLTKIFFKAGMLAHLEKLRTEKLFNSATLIQSNIRKLQYRENFLNIRKSIISLQNLILGFNTRTRVRKEIETNAAVKLQTLIRGFMARQKFVSTTRSITKLQSVIRGQQTRKNLLEQHKLHSTIVIQRSIKTFKERSHFKKLQKAAVVTQSVYRSKLAQEQLKSLKLEARSVNRLKEASYKLENKVIELSSSLTAKMKENKSLIEQLEELKLKLEDSSKTHEELKSKEAKFQESFDNQTESHSKELEQLNLELASSREEFAKASKTIEELTLLQTQLKTEVKDTMEELNKAKEELTKHETIESDLKSQISSLKNELDILSKQVHTKAATSRNVGNSNMTTPKKSRSMGTGLNGSPGRDDESHSYSPKPSVLPISNAEDDVISTISSLSAITNELYTLLQDSKLLHQEIAQGLLKNLKIPTAGVMTELSKKEVLFPARIIIIILSDMWRLGLTKESEDFLGEILAVIQNIVSSLKDDDVIPHGAFWLSNTHELYSFVSYAENTIVENEAISNDMGAEEYGEYLKLVEVVKEDFESLSYNIYNMWMKKMRKDLEKKVISAVVLSQALPGFMTTESAPFLSKVFSGSTQYKMDDIISFFNTVYWSMKTYAIEPEVVNEVIIELLKYIDGSCFNDLIMRRNFLSWKRGLQLNYNITRIEEWCKTHEIPNSQNYLILLLQSAKLLQLKKSSVEDIEIIFDICYALKPFQIQKLLQQYAVADYEAPLDSKVLNMVAERVKEQQGDSNGFLEQVNDGNFEDPFRKTDLRPFSKVEAYVPAWLNLPHVRRIIELVTKNAAAQEYMNSQEAENGDPIHDYEE